MQDGLPESRRDFSVLYDADVETALLADLIAHEDAFDRAARLRESWFYHAVHGRIFAAIRRYRAANTPFTAVALAQQFVDDPDLSDCGGASYILDLAQMAFRADTRANVEHLETMHMRRMVQSLSERLGAVALTAYEAPGAILCEAERLIREATETVVQNSVLHVSDCTAETIRFLVEQERGISSGIAALDGLMRGFMKGQLIILAGRPGMGKTALALTLALNAALAQNRVLFQSCEMTKEDLTARLLSRLSEVPVHAGGNAASPLVAQAADRLNSLPLFIDDSSGLTVADIAANARRQRRTKGLDMLVVDYLGLILAENKMAPRVHQVEEITVALKALAKELSIPILLLCQLSRAVEARDDKRPLLSDLRDSGAIEQDADAVVFVYREDYYVRDRTPDEGYRNRSLIEEMPPAPDPGFAELIVAKLRQGRRGTATCRFDGERQVFHDL